MSSVAKGKRVGQRRRRGFRPIYLVLSIGITAAVVAWGYLVYAAIEFGRSARGGENDAWLYLVLASIGAIACLFAGLMLSAQLLRALGLTSSST